MERERLNLELSKAVVDRAKALADKVADGNRSETVRQAIDVYGQIADAVAAGGKVVLRQPDGTERELLFVELELQRKKEDPK